MIGIMSVAGRVAHSLIARVSSLCATQVTWHTVVACPTPKGLFVHNLRRMRVRYVMSRRESRRQL